jgi:hypothetical protein
MATQRAIPPETRSPSTSQRLSDDEGEVWVGTQDDGSLPKRTVSD